MRAAWIGAALVGLSWLVGATGCLPPPIDDPAESGEVGIVTNLDLITPSTGATVVVRGDNGGGEVVQFLVKGAFRRTAPFTDALNYYWYVDWTPEVQVAPIAFFTNSTLMLYTACQLDFDPLGVDGSLPNSRTVLLVVSTEPLESEIDAYLGTAEGATTVIFEWDLKFEGTCD